MIFFFFIDFFPYHIEISKLLSHGFFLTNHTSKDICKVAYQYLWPKT
jgi:hypothetical protein